MTEKCSYCTATATYVPEHDAPLCDRHGAAEPHEPVDIPEIERVEIVDLSHLLGVRVPYRATRHDGFDVESYAIITRGDLDHAETEYQARRAAVERAVVRRTGLHVVSREQLGEGYYRVDWGIPAPRGSGASWSLRGSGTLDWSTA